MKRRILSVLQFAFGLGLIAVLFVTMKDRGDMANAVRDAARNWPALLAGLACFMGCMLLCTVRWHVLLRAQGLPLPFGRTFVLHFIGHFFNSFLFGVTGGDLVKAYFAARETRHKKAEAVSTILIDRVIGLLALIALVVVVMIARLPFFLAQRETRAALAFFFAMFVGAAVGIFLVFRQDLFARWPLLARLRDTTSVGAVLGRMYRAFQIVLTHPSTLWMTLGLSLANHLALVATAAMLGRAMDLQLRFLDYLTILPLVNAVAAVPLTPGGLGTREAAAKILFGVVGVPASRAVLLSLLMYGMVLFWSLVGGLIYMANAMHGLKRPTDLEAEAD